MIVPSIDIGAFLDPKSTQEARQEVVNQVENACRQIGFLVITNHGIPSQIIQEAFQSAKEYFNQSEDVKKQILMTPDYPYGYENGEILSQSIEKSGSKADLKETFQICLGAVGKVPAYEPKWPKQLDTFKQVMTNYYRSIEKLSSIMMKIFAIALKLPSNWFDDKIDNHMSSLRILNYPHQDYQPGEGQIRASAHTDYGSLTILAVDDAPGGLEVQNHNGNWESVQAPANSFIVNLGDLMARWTNDQWRSTMHRVVNPPPANGSELKSNRRQSIAFFLCINYDTLVECIESCQSKDNPAKYEPILAGAHLLQKHEAAQGRK